MNFFNFSLFSSALRKQKNNNAHLALTSKPTKKNKFTHSKRKKREFAQKGLDDDGTTYDTSQKTLTHTDSMTLRKSSKIQSTSDLRGETWEKHLDPASGRLFYYNKESGVTQWDEPPGFSNSKSQRLLRAVQNDSA